jgi:4'-phosphopantetheinyl transferase
VYSVAHELRLYVWRIDLAQPLPPDCASLLSPDETERANTIEDPDIQGCWIRSRIALRMILAFHGDCDARTVRFTRGPFGKPRWLTDDGGLPKLHFNITRSGTLCLIAVSPKQAVGIDIEQLSETRHIDRLLEQLLPPEQAADMQGLSADARRRAYLTVLTRTEAYAKAVGIGLQLRLRDLQVSADEFNPSIKSLAHDDPAAWRIIALNPGSGYVASLAVRDGLDRPHHVIHTRSLSFQDHDQDGLSMLHRWSASHLQLSAGRVC